MSRYEWSWRLAGVLVIGAGLLALAGCREPAPPETGAPAGGEAETAEAGAEKEAAAPPPTFTQEQFDNILYGMTLPQVRELLGAEPARQESTYDKPDSDYVAPSLTSWYIWENEDGSFIKLGFVNKKLAEKVAEDLPE